MIRKLRIKEQEVEVHYTWQLHRCKHNTRTGHRNVGLLKIRVQMVKKDDVEINSREKIAKKAIEFIKKDMKHGHEFANEIDYYRSFCKKAATRFPNAFQPQS